MKICTPMFIATLLIITKNEKQIKCVSDKERQINRGMFLQWNSTQKKKGMNTDIYINVHEPQKPYAKRQEPDIYEFLYTKFYKKAIYWWLPGAWDRGGGTGGGTD